MSKTRGFEIVTKYLTKGLTLPQRATSASAGYDLAAAEDIVIPSFWKISQARIEQKEAETLLPSVLVPTGVKAYMPDTEYLLLVNRSSNPIKNNLALPNGVGIIDADYYNNPNNEGEIFVQLINYGFEDVQIKKGERVAQGIFTAYGTIDNEEKNTNQRIGGFGSTGRN